MLDQYEMRLVHKTHKVKISKSSRVQIFAVSYFTVFIFAFWMWVAKIAKIWTLAKISRYTVILTLYVSGVTVGLSQTSYSVGEGNGSQTVCAVLSGMTQRSVTVTLSTVEGTAQGKL